MCSVQDREYRLRRENAAEKTGKNGERGREALTFEQRHLGVKNGFSPRQAGKLGENCWFLGWWVVFGGWFGEPLMGVCGWGLFVARAFQPEICPLRLECLEIAGAVRGFAVGGVGSREAAKPRRETQGSVFGVQYSVFGLANR